MAGNAFTLTGATNTSTPKTTFSTDINQGLLNFSAPKTTQTTTPKPTTSQTSVSTVKPTTTSSYSSSPITNIDNVNHTYMQGGQMYSLNPATGLYEVAKNPGVMSVQASSQPTTSVQSGLLSVPNNSNNPPTVQGQSPVDTSYAGLLQQLVSKTQMSPEELELNQRLADLKRARAEAIGNEQMMPETNAYQTGRIGIIENVNNAQQANVAQQAQNLATQRQVAGDVLKSAAGLAAPVITGFSNQAFNPQTGEFSGGTSLQSAVQNVVQKLQSGQMTYNDAVAALSGYGQGGVNALQQALPQGFNIAQSNTLAGQQGSVGVNYQLADAALKNVESIIQKLAPAQTTNIPIINRAANWISTQFGVNSDQTRAMTGAVQSLRNAYASLLASAKGGTPTDYSSQAAAEIPNEPTPNDIAAIRHNFEVLGQIRKDILGNPGTAGTQTTSSGSLFNW